MNFLVKAIVSWQSSLSFLDYHIVDFCVKLVRIHALFFLLRYDIGSIGNLSPYNIPRFFFIHKRMFLCLWKFYRLALRNFREFIQNTIEALISIRCVQSLKKYKKLFITNWKWAYNIHFLILNPFFLREIIWKENWKFSN